MRFFSTFKSSLVKLAFWGKPRVVAPEDADADVAPPLTPREATASASESLVPPATNTAGWLTRLKHRLLGRRTPASPAAVVPDSRLIEKPTAEQLRRVDDLSDAKPPSVERSWLRRLKASLVLRRRSTGPEVDTGEQSRSIEKRDQPAISRPQDGQEAEELPAEPPNRFKRFLVRLRNKWVWIPAAGFALLSLIVAVVVILAQSSHEREKLKAELQIAKKKLEQKASAPVVIAKSAPAIRMPPTTEGKKSDSPAEHVAATRAENPGIEAGDCVVKDKTSVVQNLKNCIEGFNSAMANSPEKTRKR